MQIPNNQPITDTRYVTIGEAANHLKVSPRTVYRWMKEGQLQAFRVGNVTRIAVDALVAFLKQNTGKDQDDAAG